MALSAPVVKKMVASMAPRQWCLPNPFYALAKIKDELRRVHLLIEVRDARLPFTTANYDFQKFLKWKSHMVVLTKTDLVHPAVIEEWKKCLGENYYFVNALDKASVYKVREVVKARLRESGSTLEKIKVAMLVGMPNVGKTTLANTMHRLGRWNVSRLEFLNLGEANADPYQTKEVSDLKINYFPPMYVLDTPSAMMERLPDLETAIKLALTEPRFDDVVGPIPLARLVLAMLNQHSEGLHSRWKAQDLAHKFLAKPRNRKLRADKKLIRTDDYANEVRGFISTRFLNFDGDKEDVEQMGRLVAAQLERIRLLYQRASLQKKPRVTELETCRKVLALYRAGKFGWHALDALPRKYSA